MGSEVAETLHHAHALKDESGRALGVVHRDLCPRNVRVDLGTGAVKLGGRRRVLAAGGARREPGQPVAR